MAQLCAQWDIWQLKSKPVKHYHKNTDFKTVLHCSYSASVMNLFQLDRVIGPDLRDLSTLRTSRFRTNIIFSKSSISKHVSSGRPWRKRGTSSYSLFVFAVTGIETVSLLSLPSLLWLLSLYVQSSHTHAYMCMCCDVNQSGRVIWNHYPGPLTAHTSVARSIWEITGQNAKERAGKLHLTSRRNLSH